VKNRKWPMRALLALALVIVGVSGWKLYSDYLEQQQSEAQTELKPPPMDDGSPALDFADLLAQYPDITAWLTIDNTAIDYPVVQAGDNKFYLDHTADRKSNKMGALFMDCRDNRDFSGFNTVIYGHSMRNRNDNMFGGLSKFKDRDYFNAHRTGTLYTPDAAWPLEIFAVAVAGAVSDYYGYVFESPERCQAHLDMIRDGAMFYRDIGVTRGDRILTLSTCSYEYEDARTLVIARIAE